MARRKGFPHAELEAAIDAGMSPPELIAYFGIARGSLARRYRLRGKSLGDAIRDAAWRNAQRQAPDGVVLMPLFARDGSVLTHAQIDSADHDAVRPFRWSGSGGYVIRKTPTKVKLHRYLLGATDPKMSVDHINGDGLDNRRANLRLASHAENLQNLTRLNRNNTSGYRGVSWVAGCKRWQARATIDYREHVVGYFRSRDEAGQAVADFRAAHMPFSADARRAS